MLEGRLDIVLSLKDMFDYDEFIQACLAKGVPSMPIGMYAQKVGMVMVAMKKWKNLTPKDAYTQLIEQMNIDSGAIQINPVTGVKTGCNGCGSNRII